MRSAAAEREAEDHLLARIEVALLRAMLDTIGACVEEWRDLDGRRGARTAQALAFAQAARPATARAASVIAQAAQLTPDASLAPELRALPELRRARELQPLAPALARYAALVEALDGVSYAGPDDLLAALVARGVRRLVPVARELPDNQGVDEAELRHGGPLRSVLARAARAVSRLAARGAQLAGRARRERAARRA